MDIMVKLKGKNLSLKGTAALDSFVEIWKSVQDYCRENMTEVAYNLWIDPIEPIHFDSSSITLSIKSEFNKKIVNEKFMDLLSKGFESILGFPVDINIITNDAENNEKKAETRSLKKDSFMCSGFENTFDTFIVGSSNKFAHAAAQAVASNPGGIYNPLYIYGNSGLGKTHLLNAICYEINKDNPSAEIIYTRGENFTNELIAAIKEGSTHAFHNKYRNADILLVDDIQFIAGKESTQEEFFHTFNTLTQAGKQIVMTSDRPPKEMMSLEERLKTRFEWGLLADIQPPDFETRMAIIKRKAQLIELPISDDVVQYIAEKLKTNIRQLEGTIKKIKAMCLIDGSKPNMADAQIAIKDILTNSQPVSVIVERIIEEVARTFGVPKEDIRSDKRKAIISNARQVAMYITRELTDLPLQSIGEEFDGKNHSTVLYSIEQTEKKMKENSSLRASITDIISNIREK